MMIEQLAPRQQQVDLHELLSTIGAAASLQPFDPRITGFCADFSQAIFADPETRTFPELQALAFWMRKAELARMQKAFAGLQTADTVLVPRGLVFHIPPANVDTIFIYSWLISVLMGNRNIVRVSHRASRQTELICRVFNVTLAKADNDVRQNSALIRYAHQREITAAVSAVADVRVIWGGNATVEAIRAVPLPPHGKEVIFPDRYSFSVVKAEAYLDLDVQKRGELARQFYNDTFWFDQMACSSPRLLVWCGQPGCCREASRVFFNFLEAQLRQQGYSAETSMRLNRFTFACQAILDQEVSGYSECGHELVLLDLGELGRIRREHCGGGLLFQFHTPSLDDLANLVERRDQTLTQFGFSNNELRKFAELVNGRGVDRIVPIGQALTFHRYWDGYDLFQELTRRIHIPAT